MGLETGVSEDIFWESEDKVVRDIQVKFGGRRGRMPDHRGFVSLAKEFS